MIEDRFMNGYHKKIKCTFTTDSLNIYLLYRSNYATNSANLRHSKHPQPSNCGHIHLIITSGKIFLLPNLSYILTTIFPRKNLTSSTLLKTSSFLLEKVNGYFTLKLGGGASFHIHFYDDRKFIAEECGSDMIGNDQFLVVVRLKKK